MPLTKDAEPESTEPLQHRLQVLIPSAWLPELDAAASVNGLSRSDVVRMALRGFLTARHESGV